MTESMCDWCGHADKCERRKGLQTRTVVSGGIGGLKEVAVIREIIVTCNDYKFSRK